MKLSTVTLCTSAVLAWAGSPLTSALFAVAWLFHRRWEKTLASDSGQDIAEYAVMLDACGITDGRSKHDASFVYPLTPGAVIRPDKYDPDPRIECSSGIHFFLTPEEAEAF